MSTRLNDAILRLWADLRQAPTEKRVRGLVGDQVVVDSTRVLLVWEPRRVVPTYAVPVEDVHVDLAPTGQVEPGGPAVLHPGIPFTVHSTPGEALSVRSVGRTLADAAFRPSDVDLAGYVVLDFDAFDGWLEEDEPVRGHPRDPYHRVDVRASSRHVRIEHEGQLIADSTRPVLVFETNLPTRFYLPREDVVSELHPSALTTYCPYKGEASYWSIDSIDGRADIAWSYLTPLPDATKLAGLIAFYDDVLDLTVDGAVRRRPDTVVSRALLDEFGV